VPSVRGRGKASYGNKGTKWEHDILPANADPLSDGQDHTAYTGQPEATARTPIHHWKESAQHIRLLKLAPKPPYLWNPPACTIVHVNISDPIFYVVVSYTWELRADWADISLDGYSLRVRGNISDLLTALQRPNEDMLLWIDAICINQADEDEMSTQISMMGVYTLPPTMLSPTSGSMIWRTE